MQTPVASIRDDSHNILCEEFLRERAAVLSRAGHAVQDALAKLRTIESRLQGLQENPAADPESVNEMIEQFNDVRRLAELKYYYLIVTREALGLRKHDRVQDIYRIPQKKKRIQAT